MGTTTSTFRSYSQEESLTRGDRRLGREGGSGQERAQ